MGKLGKRSIDRISNLPDELISHILSMLPTKDAVATSVLSTRWEFLWASITNVDFDCDCDEGSYSEETCSMTAKKFTQFVNRVLLLLNPPTIQNFRLKCIQRRFDASYLNSWICVAFGRAIRELDLTLMLDEPMELPLNRIYCNVAVLKLNDDIHLKVRAFPQVCFASLQTLHLDEITFEIDKNSSVSFPNLKILYLNCVTYANEESIHKLFSSCPVLDDLHFGRDHWDNVVCLVIRIPSLTRLTLIFDIMSVGEFTYKVQIDTPSLQYLNVDDDFPCEYLLAGTGKLSSLLKAKVRFGFIDTDVVNSFINVSRIMRSLSNVKSLSVSGLVLKGIRIAFASILPSFHNLISLKLEEQDCHDLSVVNNVLENMDNLEHLDMKEWKCNCSNQSWWTEPLNVPKCLLSRISTISFTCEKGACCNQLEMLRYFLKYGEVLQMLTISTRLPVEKNFEMLQKILMLPRGSRTCQVAFA